MDMLTLHKPIPRGAVWLSFDDGFRALRENVLPLVREYKVPITLFIPSGIVEGDGMFPWLPKNGPRQSLTLPELKEIAAYSEVTIGSHTVNHVVTARVAGDALRYELAESKRALESWTGAMVECFAYPEGRYDGRERQALIECGYKLAATTNSALLTPDSDPYLAPRFSVADNISFPEAICNMVGVWSPATSPIKRVIRRGHEALSGVTQHLVPPRTAPPNSMIGR
ncbi:MAG TPA: polysaccharide deacetylase family protein [Bryobacteraceae bacterium]|nr:polysaccharide deacetylase family protein [Bryobacteraceae bacterium]